MQCEGFRPGCLNVAIHSVRGYNFCTSCAREFAGYTPAVDFPVTPHAQARKLFVDSAIPLDPMAREVLIALVADLLHATEQAARKHAAQHLNEAMDDVERPRTPGVQPSRHLSTDDVRRLAAELEA